MEINRLTELISGTDKNALVGAFTGLVSENKTKQIKCWIDQYNPDQHSIVKDPLGKRPVKFINGTTITYSKLPIPYQQLIVKRRAAFLVGNPIRLECSPKGTQEKGLYACVQKIWNDNKLDYDSKTLAKILMSETECAEIWYTEPVDADYWNGTILEGATNTLRMKILANSMGDKLYPAFNSRGDLIAIAREYNLTKEDKQEEMHFDIYTADAFYQGTHDGNNWVFETISNVGGKIPMVYYSQALPEWDIVQRLIERKEELISNHADTNDRLGNPMLVSRGEVVGLETDLGTVKVVKLEGQDASLDVLSWDNAPASIELEQKNLRSFIMDMTDTPDISLDQMKSLGTFSGIALKLLFLGAHMAASDKEEIFGKCIQRRINYIKDQLIKMAPKAKLQKTKSLVIKPVFTLYLPKDDAGEIDMLVSAVQGEIMSKQTAVRQNPRIEDADAEITLIEKEQQTTTPQQLNNEMNNPTDQNNPAKQ